MNKVELTPTQCRMARVGLHLGIREVAELADVASSTVSRFERGDENLHRRTIKAIREGLEEAGAVFITTDEGDKTVVIREGKE